MSWKLYSKWWITTKNQLQKLSEKEKELIQTTKSTKDRPFASCLVGGLYAKYCMIVQEIDECLDQMCQVQKTGTVRKLMDAATIRLNELKEELVKIDISEYHYIDGSLIQLKLIPHSVEILHPALMYPRPIEVQEMWERIKKGEQIFDRAAAEAAAAEAAALAALENPETALDMLKNLEEQKKAEEEKKQKEKEEEEAKKKQEEEEQDEEKKKQEEEERKKEERKKKRKKKFVKEEKVLTAEELAELKRKEEITEAVRMIQRMERARQSALYFLDLCNSRGGRRRAEAASRRKEVVDNTDKEIAATKIQRYWRGYAVRQWMKRRERDRRLLIGMTEPSWRSKEPFIKMEQTFEQRRAKRDQHIKDYIKANLDEKERVLRVVGPGLMEDIGDEIREWFYQWYIRARNFDKYPPPEKGGTVLVVRGETMTPEEWIDEVERRRRAKVKGHGLDKERKRQEKEKKKKEAAEKKKREKEKKRKEKELQKRLAKRGEGFEFKFKESPVAPVMDLGFHEYHELWDPRKDEDNPTETHYMDIITEQKCYEMQLELREKVDEVMRLELELLKDALERDKLRLKGKKGKKKKKKKHKKKKKKKKKQKGRKGLGKDITKTRTTEDLFQELFDNGIIRTYPKVRLSEFKGDFSYQNWDLRMQEYDPPATLGDVRQAVMLNCILPLGVEIMDKPKSAIIVGPRSSGIHLLANAVFTETQCVLFDLSPENLVGKYEGKDGMKMLIHLVNKMSRILQPSIIYIDGGERPFYKKVPKEEKELEPKRIGKKLVKNIVKPINNEDRIFLLAISRAPWAGKKGKMKKAYQRTILIPRPDYGSVYLFWREMLMQYHGVDRDLDVSAIAKVTINYPIPAIRNACHAVLSPRRIIQLKYKPLDMHELLNALFEGGIPLISDKEWKKYVKWYNKTALGRQKAKYMKIINKKREQANRSRKRR